MAVNKISSFQGDNRYLSNFYPAPFKYKNRMWDTSEHAFQAAKAVNPVDAATIRAASTPGKAKRMGRVIVIRPDWDDIRVQVMDDIVFAKFDQNPSLKQRLLDTEDAELVEGNHWGDDFWGVPHGRHGENHLGKILMSVRSRLRDREYTQQSERIGASRDDF